MATVTQKETKYSYRVVAPDSKAIRITSSEKQAYAGLIKTRRGWRLVASGTSVASVKADTLAEMSMDPSLVYFAIRRFVKV